jgi:asparagine synthase (glutamine-hydrolysing)
MCGIAGLVTQRDSPSSSKMSQDEVKSRLAAMTSALAHRGPDDEGIQVLESEGPPALTVGMGNRRLAILDLSTLGHQPMRDDPNGNWITYNGEVYNFAAVRQDLEARGCVFRSQTDTETILKSYGEYGVDAIKRWRGMFACALWDARLRKLLLVRDRLGVKPLYYYWDGKTLLFSSEVRPLLASGLVPKRLDIEGTASFLSWGAVQDPSTMIEGVRSLLPGHYAEFDGSEFRIRRYWDLPQPAPSRDGALSVSEARQQTRGLLEESVRLRLVSDVPLGVFLSGGIDSSAVVALMTRNSARVKTFSIVFREREYDEALYSRMVSEKFRTDHSEVLVTEEDLLRELPAALGAMDQPTMDGINTYFVSKAAKQAGLSVALSGLGGDEVFCGYKTFRMVPRMEQMARWLNRLPPAARQAIAQTLTIAGGNHRWRKVGLLCGGNGDVGHPYFLTRLLFTRPELRQLLQPDWQRLERERLGAQGWPGEVLEGALAHDPVNRVSCLELRTYMANTLLRDLDAMSMAHSLEVREPLIDHKLIEFVLALPGRLKADGGTPKKLLVQALNGDLPEQIVYRRKKGFNFPFERWLRQELRPVIESTLQSPAFLSRTFLRLEAVQEQWRTFLGGRTSWSRPWSLYVLARWCELNL